MNCGFWALLFGMPSSKHSDDPTEMTAMTDAEVTSHQSGPRGGEGGQGHVVFRGRSPAGKYLLAFLVVLSVTSLGYLLAKVAMGSLYVHSCPLDQWVPLYLVISSSLMLTFVAVILVVYLKCRRTHAEDSVAAHHLIALVYFFLHLVMQLAGSVCVIRTRNDLVDRPVTSHVTSMTCDLDILEFAYGVVIFELVLSGIVLTAVVLVLMEAIYLVCCHTEGEKQGAPS